MKKILVLVSFLVSSSIYSQIPATENTPFQIDKVATAKAPWKIGEKTADIKCDDTKPVCYKVFLGMTTEGKVVVQEFYLSGKKASEPYIVVTQKDAALVAEYPERPGAEGFFTGRHENGQKESEGFYEHGKRQGVWSFWYENGQKNREGLYADDEKNGVWVKYLGGHGKFEYQYKDDLLHGLYTWQDVNGRRCLEYRYARGKIHGCAKEWYADGSIRKETRYQNGQKEGIATLWHSNGQKALEGLYKDNQLHGVYTQWHATGQKYREGVYKKGRKDGRWSEWYESGEKRVVCQFKNGKRLKELA